MQLFYRKFGENKPVLIILHGLYGMSDNWVSIAKQLSENFEVFVIDQRNHGQSFHSDIHTYDALQNDLLEFMKQQNIEKSIILGHSMGGKTAMKFAEENYEMINSLIIVDISPVNNQEKIFESKKRHLEILKAMQSINLNDFAKREEIKTEILKKIPEQRVADYILKNLKRQNNKFVWKLNVDALINNIDNIISNLDFTKEISGFPVLFIKGEKSQYIENEDIKSINKFFPAAEIKTIKNAGHWVHAEKPDELINIMEDFIL